jgi:putative redox protein
MTVDQGISCKSVKEGALSNPQSITCATEGSNAYPVELHVRGHTFRSDVGVSSGSADSAPGPHDYFDAALAACKALTATWYARKHQIPLERVSDVNRLK